MALPGRHTLVDGINMTSLYFGDALAEIDFKLKRSLQANTKPAPRQFTGNAPSPEEIEVLNDLADQYYATLVKGLMNGRGFTEDQAKASLDQGGFTAQEALKAKMVDRLMYPDDITDGLKELTGKRVWLTKWRKTGPQYRARWDQPKAIAVIPILGTIVNGRTASDFFGNTDGSATGATTVIEAIEEAVERPDIHAIIASRGLTRR